jgi:hypothetical protein
MKRFTPEEIAKEKEKTAASLVEETFDFGVDRHELYHSINVFGLP